MEWPSGGASSGLNQDILDALKEANAPSADKPFVTLSDNPVLSEKIDLALITKNGTKLLKANTIVLRMSIKVNTAYSVGATLKAGTRLDDDLFSTDGEIDLQTEQLTTLNFIETLAEEDKFRFTITGSPEAGAATIIMEYINV